MDLILVIAWVMWDLGSKDFCRKILLKILLVKVLIKKKDFVKIKR